MTDSPTLALHLRHDRRLVMAALGLMLVPFLWYVRTDLMLYAGDWRHLTERFLVRGGIVAILVAGVALIGSVRTRGEYARRLFWLAWCVAIALVAINGLRPAGLTLPLRSPLFHLMVLYGAMPNRFWLQILPPLALSAGLIVLRLTRLTGVTDADVAGDVLILLVLNTVGALVVQRRIALERDLHQAWTAEHEARLASERALGELRVLRGIIPICAHCKKVRTTIGDWQQIERYVEDHSEADFSHGICPDCLREHYPRFA